jgi:hypothetical protein
LRAYAGYSELGHMHTLVSLLTGRIPVDRLIFVEDCCLISVGVEGVSRVLHYRFGGLVEVYSIQLFANKP